MIPTITADVRRAYALLEGIAERVGDSSRAWWAISDDVFDFQKRWWFLTYGGQTDKQRRPGRDPQLMVESGGLRRSATVKGAQRQRIRTGRDYLLIEVTHGLATIHENRGRPVLGTPGRRETLGYARKVGRYMLTGRT